MTIKWYIKWYHFTLIRCIKSDQGLISLHVNYNEQVGTKENCNAFTFPIHRLNPCWLLLIPL